MSLIKSRHIYVFTWRTCDTSDILKMRDNKACKTVFCDNSNVGNVIIYLFMPDFLWASTTYITCSEDSSLITLSHNFILNHHNIMFRNKGIIVCCSESVL